MSEYASHVPREQYDHYRHRIGSLYPEGMAPVWTQDVVEEEPMTHDEYEIWLSGYNGAVEACLVEGSSAMPVVPDRVWKYWAVNGQILNGADGASTDIAH